LLVVVLGHSGAVDVVAEVDVQPTAPVAT